MTRRWRLVWRGHAVIVEADRDEAGPFLARYLGLPVTPHDAAHSAHVAVLRHGAGYRARVADESVDARSWQAARLALLEAVAYAFAQTGGVTVLHAGAWHGPKGAVALLGGPRAGKTYLTFAAWRQGRTVLGDDRVALRGAALGAFPKCLKLRVAAGAKPADVLPDAAPGSAFAADLGGERRLVIARTLPGFAGYETAHPLRAIVVLERARGPRSVLDAIPAVEALERVLPSGGAGVATPMSLVRALKPFVESGRIPRLGVGADDAEGALALLDRL